MENISVSLISACSALAGVWIAQYFEGKKREDEAQRWYVDYFLGKKIEALTGLYAAMVECYLALDAYSSFCAPNNLSEFKENVSGKVDVFLRAKAVSSIYLSDDIEKTLIDVCASFKHGRMAVWLKLPDCPADESSYDARAKDVTDEGRLEKKYEKAVAWFRQNLNPDILEAVRKTKNQA